MKVLVACEESGVVRDAFRKKGHDAYSCDLLPSEDMTYHKQQDVLNLLNNHWDMMIAFPPCTHLACSGAAHFKKKRALQLKALSFVNMLLNASIKKIALENPVGVISTKIRKPDQIIQPWQFGEPHQKTTCLWLKGLPKLIPTKIVEPQWVIMKNGQRMSAWHYNSFFLPKDIRGKVRSKTFQGIADAMADQWGSLDIS